MTRQWFRTTCLLAMAVALIAGTAPVTSVRADDDEPESDPGVQVRTPLRGQWWTNQEVAEYIKLTADQKTKIQKIFDDAKKDLDAKRTKQSKLRIQVAETLETVKFDHAAYTKALNEYTKLQADWARAHLDYKMKIRQILTSEQLKRLLERDRMVMRRAWHRGQSRQAMRRGRQGGAQRGRRPNRRRMRPPLQQPQQPAQKAGQQNQTPPAPEPK